MTAEEVIELARNLRNAQEAYQKDRSPARLRGVRDLERRIDKALAQYQAAKDEAASPVLFGGVEYER